MGRKIRLVNKRRFILACMTLASFCAFAYVLVSYFMTSRSTWSGIEAKEGSELTNQKVSIIATPGGGILYPGDTVTFVAMHYYTIKATGEEKSMASEKKVAITPSDPVVGTVNPDTSEFNVTQHVSEKKTFYLTAAYEDKTAKFDYSLMPLK